MKDVIKGSSMRMNLILAAIGAFIMMLSVSAYIIIAAINKDTNEPSWEAMALFAIGIASILTGVGWTKAKQKETESKTNEKV